VELSEEARTARASAGAAESASGGPPPSTETATRQAGPSADTPARDAAEAPDTAPDAQRHGLPGQAEMSKLTLKDLLGEGAGLATPARPDIRLTRGLQYQSPGAPLSLSS
jgi:hypothetical protein